MPTLGRFRRKGWLVGSTKYSDVGGCLSKDARPHHARPGQAETPMVDLWRQTLVRSTITSPQQHRSKVPPRDTQQGELRVTCGRRPGKNFLTFCSISRVRSRVRPVGAAGVAAGPNALRGAGPNRKPALEVR